MNEEKKEAVININYRISFSILFHYLCLPSATLCFCAWVLIKLNVRASICTGSFGCVWAKFKAKEKTTYVSRFNFPFERNEEKMAKRTLVEKKRKNSSFSGFCFSAFCNLCKLFRL